MNLVQQPIYDREAVAFMWKELQAVGVNPLTTADQVDRAIKQTPGTTLVVVNSVCGCSAGSARPGVGLALQNGHIPDQSTTVFAGVDMEAVKRAREHMTGMPPSSPSIALFKDGNLVYMMHRRDIEGSNAESVAARLTEVFNTHCTKPGPSVPFETLRQVFGGSSPQCGGSYEKG